MCTDLLANTYIGRCSRCDMYPADVLIVNQFGKFIWLCSIMCDSDRRKELYFTKPPSKTDDEISQLEAIQKAIDEYILKFGDLSIPEQS